MGATLGGGGAALPIDGDPVHARHVDHDAVVAGREAGDAVASSAHRDEQVLFASEADGGDDVFDACRTGDEGWAAVGHPIPDDAGLVVGGVGRADELAFEAVTESGERGRPHSALSPSP